MSEITSEIESAIESLGISDQVRRLSAEKEKQLYTELISEFVGGNDMRWWWEGFTKPFASISFADGMGFKRLPTLAPVEPCWLVAEDAQSSVYPIYEASPELASRVIGECIGFEYYLIAKDMRWLICENHHGVVVGVGPDVIGAISRAAA